MWSGNVSIHLRIYSEFAHFTFANTDRSAPQRQATIKAFTRATVSRRRVPRQGSSLWPRFLSGFLLHDNAWFGAYAYARAIMTRGWRTRSSAPFVFEVVIVRCPMLTLLESPGFVKCSLSPEWQDAPSVSGQTCMNRHANKHLLQRSDMV